MIPPDDDEWSAEDYGDLDQRAPAPAIPLRPQKPGEEWKAGLRYNDKGLTKDPGNAALILANDPAWASLRFDEFSGRETCSHPPPLAGMPVPTTPEGFELYAGHWLAKRWQQTFAPEHVRSAIHFAARQRPYHQVRDYLDGLAWDGTRRVDRWLHTYLGAEPTPATEAIGRMWLISAVARAYVPGAKADHMLVLEGSQGARKTTALEALCSSSWFQPELGDLRNKDSQLTLRGKWVVCMDELHALRSADVTELAKNYLTRTVDKYRPPYGRHEIEQPRSCIFAGTTNADAYLTDPTGNRRFWPVRVAVSHPVDVASLTTDRDQLWAEAVALYQDKQPWWPDRTLASTLADLTDDRTQVDEWDAKVAGYLAGYDSVSVGEILAHIGLDTKDWEPRHQLRVSRLLSRFGWKRRQSRAFGKREWRYHKP